MEKTTRFSKRFAAWATALTDSYRANPFIRTTTHIIALQALVVLVTIAVFWWAIGYTQSNIVTEISGLLERVVAGEPVELATLVEEIDAARTRTLTLTFAGLVLLTALFGYLLARFALKPARHSLQFQKRFIGNVAHEIRTPLAIVKTSTEVALMDPNVPKHLRRTLSDTIVELDRMSETINNLLTFDNLVRPERVRPTAVNICDIAETVIARHRPFADARGVSLTLVRQGTCFIWGHTTALDQAVSNLVKNAIAYTPEHRGGKVSITLELDGEKRIAITVKDTGIGIPEKDLYHIFEPFYRVDTSRVRKAGTGSSGLGLAIVNEIVRMHKGVITVRSTVGEGTSIRIALPKAPAPQEPGTQPASDQRDLPVRSS